MARLWTVRLRVTVTESMITVNRSPQQSFALKLFTKHNSTYSRCATDEYDWCVVPDSGYDVIVFAGVAVVVSCLFRGRFSNLMILVAGMASIAMAFGAQFGSVDASVTHVFHA